MGEKAEMVEFPKHNFYYSLLSFVYNWILWKCRVTHPSLVVGVVYRYKLEDKNDGFKFYHVLCIQIYKLI